MKVKKTTVFILSLSFRIILLALIVIGLLKSGQMAYEFGLSVFLEEAVSEEPGRNITVIIEEGTATAEIGKLLEQKGLIIDHRLFYVQVKLSKYSNALKPGTYTLNTSMTSREMMSVMSLEQTEETEQ